MIHLTDISLQHGSKVILQRGSLQILANTKTGLVGPNGAGKTTIFRLITGEETPDKGDISCPKNCTIGYFSQDVGEMSGRSVIKEVMAGMAELVKLGKEIRKMELAMAEPMEDDELAALLERYGDASEIFEKRGGYDLESRCQAILSGLGFAVEDFNNPVESFSGGWKMRIALAKILILNPDVLLLDEPTNHLDMESILWLEEWLKSEFQGALLMTCHDRVFMDKIVDRIIEISGGSATTYSGNYDFYLREREVRRNQLMASYRRQQEMLAKEEEFIARFAARASHAAQVQSRIKKLEKIERIVLPAEQRTIRFEFPVPERSGEDVLHLHNVGKTWLSHDNREIPVFHGLSGTIRRLEKIALIGVNGAGKSTLLRIIAGRTSPTQGEVVYGAGVSPGYFSQHSMELLSPEQTVFEAVQEMLPMENIGVIRNLCGAFLFSGDDVEKKISTLSGGEKSRVVLAGLLGRNLNFLILDEPTNHLDIDSREVLLEALVNFTGTVILVSHDRHFLQSLTNRVFEINHGEMRILEGDYSYYLREAKKMANGR
jgi:ATP-binding cassette subfamily F protein 3